MTLQANNEPVVVPPDRIDPLVDKETGNGVQRFYTWIQAISQRIPIEGSGSPESRFEANAGRLYVDRDGAQGERIYMKTTNGGNTGWELA